MTSVGLLLADGRGALELAAYSGEPARLLGDLEVVYTKGPSTECYRTGRPARYSTRSPLAVQWPELTHAAEETGITTLHAIPMRRREGEDAVLTLVTGEHDRPRTGTLRLAWSLADAATIGLLNQRTVRRHEHLSAQLQTALTSRIPIEQAKGVLAGRLGITVSEAFTLLRGHAPAHNVELHSVAEAVINGDVSIAHPAEPSPAQQPVRPS